MFSVLVAQKIKYNLHRQIYITVIQIKHTSDEASGSLCSRTSSREDGRFEKIPKRPRARVSNLKKQQSHKYLSHAQE